MVEYVNAPAGYRRLGGKAHTPRDPDRAKWQTPWHHRLARLGGAMLRVGWSLGAVRAALEVENTEGGVMKHDDADVLALGRWLDDQVPEDERDPTPWAVDPAGYVVAWRREARLNHRAAMVLLELTRWAHLDGTARVPQAIIADRLGIDRSNVRRALQELGGAGVVLIRSTAERTKIGQRGRDAVSTDILQAPQSPIEGSAQPTT
jgi:hypothetical protein